MTGKNLHIIFCDLLITIAVSFSFCVDAVAQDFKVRSFRQLPNDITAYINPIRDLNQEACALIKIVGDKDFAFSSPLGIVHRVNEVGEIWIYLPRGSKLLTIKHPRWGVMRDFSFGAQLESRMTYEMVLSPPLSKEFDLSVPMNNNPEFPFIGYGSKESNARLSYIKVRQPLVFQLLYTSGLHNSSYSGGLMFAVRRRHGVYLHLQTDFHSSVSTSGECDKDGGVDNDGSLPYYNGVKKDSRWMAFVGGIHHLTNSFDVYEGIGYGNRSLAWQTVNETYLLNTGYSAKGIAGELGIIYEPHLPLYLSAGIMTIKGKYWEPVVGIGYRF